MNIWCKLGHPFDLGYKIIKTDARLSPWRVVCENCDYEHDGVSRLK